MAKRRFIVDGYNVIRSSGLYDRYDGEDYSGVESGLNAMREALVSDVAAYALGEYQDVTVVFDGGKNANSAGSKTRLGGVTVMFSRAGQTADSVIEKICHEARGTGDEIVVVTSDAMVQWTVLGDHVTRMSASGFANEIRHTGSEAQDGHDIFVGNVKNTLGERIGAEAYDKLRQMVDGQGQGTSKP